MSKKNLAFVTAASSDILFAAANVALACNRYCHGKDYDILVYYDEPEEQALNALKKIPHCIPRQMRFPPKFIETILQCMAPYSRGTSRKSLMAFCTFEIFALLEHYKTVIWHDIDISIQAEIDELTAHRPLALPDDGGFTVQMNFVRPVPGYDMNKPGCRSSLVVVQDSLPYNAMYAWCWEKSLQYAPVMFNRDQGILNLCIQEFSLKPVVLSLERWSCLPDSPAAQSAAIVHFGGHIPFWSEQEYREKLQQWHQRHAAWRELGGTDYPAALPKAAVPAPVWDGPPPQRDDIRIMALCFGIGEMASFILPAIRKDRVWVESFVDERPAMRHATFAGRPVIGIEDIAGHAFDYIFIACRPADAIRDKLLRAGVPAVKIVPLDMEALFAEKTLYWSCFFADIWDYLGQCPCLQTCIDIKTLASTPWIKRVLAEILKRMHAKKRSTPVADEKAHFRNELAAQPERRLLDRLHTLGVSYLHGRLDYRLVRLEMLLYYQDAQRREQLNPEQLAMLDYLNDGYFDREGNENRFYPCEPPQGRAPADPNRYGLECSASGDYVAHYNGIPIHLAPSLRAATSVWGLCLRHLDTPGVPHEYIAADDPAFAFPPNAVLADVGGAEGFFTVKYFHSIAKSYIFESDPAWIPRLRRTFAGHEDKVEIVEAFIGCREGELSLDAFFRDKVPPTFVKMDVEGAEDRVLRGMQGLIENTALPMQLAVCLYRRQEDEALFTELLKDFFSISYSNGYFWHMPDPRPPYFRRGVLRAIRGQRG